MRASLNSLHNDVAVAIEFFQGNPDAREIPFLHSFPRGACERTAALLAVALARKYKSDRIIYVKGRNRLTGEMHFWLEIGDLVIDPTAHQYDEYDRPLICTRPSPLELKFQRESE